jgi:hypothetical protein
MFFGYGALSCAAAAASAINIILNFLQPLSGLSIPPSAQ